ncbi:TraG family conjugative transposon ATPase [Ilyomonas limi]|uniref:TraG family conjugative transposon ATPase n=1 Tax=Ilyomonas limi TaxID=2575867 RepID=A0A4U3KV47_9BACT|nr:TraG family conjugative transposon ATPase [Ilyomonas limi]TKK66341.1 TraG family conjugative transposon ATPase [Ilyomonas limi]
MEKWLEEQIPIATVEHNCIASKNGDITALFRAVYPECLTRSNEEYERLNQARIKAINSLPDNSLFVQQDHYRKKVFSGNTIEASFLATASNTFFNGRTYFEHECIISVVKMPVNRRMSDSGFNNLLRSSVVPEQTISANLLQEWEGNVNQFKRLMQEAGIQLQRLTDGELLSDDKRAGIIEQYLFQIGDQYKPLVKDIDLEEGVKIGDTICRFFTLADINSFPTFCSSRITHDAYSTDKSLFPVSYASYLGMLLPVDHVTTTYVLLHSANESKQRNERKARHTFSLARYSRENAISNQAINEYLQELTADSKRPCFLNVTVMTIAMDRNEANMQVEVVRAAFAQIDAVPKFETVCGPQLFFAGIPGNAADLPKDHVIETFTDQASCFLNSDTAYMDGKHCSIRLAERLYGRPVNVDLFDEPMERGIITNRNMIVVGGSGGGKSVFTNHLSRSLYDAGAHAVIVDIGGSYKGLCTLLNGYYFTYTEANPIRFNPFYIAAGEPLDTEKKESLKALLVSLWKKENESFNRAEYVALSNALQGYYDWLFQNQHVFPSFNTFYEYLEEVYVLVLKDHRVKEKDFDINNFLYVLRPYYKDGEFDYLLNATENLDLLQQRFIVFELDNIKDHPILFPVVTLIIMELFISKMRKLKGARKVLVIEEAWKAITKAGMAEFIKYVYKTVRKFNGIAVVVTQELDDVISSPVIKEAIINNADIKVLMDMRKFMNKFDALQAALGLSDKGKTILLSVNRNNEPGKKYREVFIDLGGQVMKVYRNELSPEEYFTYTTEEREKLKVQEYTEKYGSMEKGIKRLVADINRTTL